MAGNRPRASQRPNTTSPTAAMRIGVSIPRITFSTQSCSSLNPAFGHPIAFGFAVVEEDRFPGISIFYLLQLADGLTTLIFLTLGIAEGNPIVHFVMAQTNPVAGLLLSKLVCITVGGV